MPKPIKKRSKKAGLPPGTLVHIGEKKAETPKITIMDYDEAHFQEKETKTIEECLLFKDKPTVTWINIDGLHQVEILERLGECYGLHPLVLEDILNTDQRPKMEDYGEYLFIVLRMLNYNDKSSEIEAEQISLILGTNFVLSFQEKEGDTFNPIRERIRNSKGRIRRMGADYLSYSLLDSIVDNYFIILEKLGEKIEFLEDELVTRPTPETLQIIHHLKREMIYLRKAVWPLREVIGSLERGEPPLVKETIRVYLRDVYDHTIQVIDTIETFRDMVSGMLDIYLSSISNRLNAVMKVLTIIATIFMPLTFLAGIYGMNFKYMPELEWRWSYPVVWLIMVGIGVSMLLYFRKKKWL
ncbi:MAG: magnesium and cobalt transport protein CorA [Deltaproteobacteria bacterium CG03_land_8_20_14_0_80_45_14]|jgi:magnesium transporter|nr:MAG: magnesium and cobalt transport protein CorA [Deltaproteobacteria bacterium CG03_land_8_20_14_0_80_45_14]